MKKIISALLICMLAAVCLFTGCSKAKGLKVKDSSGNDRVLVTDENGKPVYDEAGNKTYFGTKEAPGDFYKIVKTASDLWVDVGLISKAVDAGSIIDGSFLTRHQ